MEKPALPPGGIRSVTATPMKFLVFGRVLSRVALDCFNLIETRGPQRAGCPCGASNKRDGLGKDTARRRQSTSTAR
jgi:hypothetical protein